LIAGAVLFLVAAYFCLGPFRQSAGKKPGAEAKRRARLYTGCGWAILVCILVLVIAKLPLIDALIRLPDLTYLAEWVMLWAFGLAWMVAAKFFPWLTTEAERRSLPAEMGNATNVAQAKATTPPPSPNTP
jgi:hypothetical protein